MIPVDQEDVENRLRRELTADEVQWLDSILEESSALIEGYLGVEYPEGATDVPRPVIVVTSRVAARILTMSENDVPALPADTFTRGMGPFSATHTFTPDSTSGGPWLTKTDKVMLAPFRLGGAMTIPLVRETGWVAGS